MKIIYPLASLLVLLLASSAAWSLSDQDCDYAGNQSQMNACARRDYEKADRELNHAYKKIMRNLTQQKQKALREEQRAWLKERDPKCRKVANDVAEGGSLWPLEFDTCRETSTRNRIEQLKKWKK